MSAGQPSHTGEQDRLALRVEIDPNRIQPPLIAAWELGRLCNEMRFRFEFAWIRYCDNEPDRTAQLWADTAALIRRTEIDSQSRCLAAYEYVMNRWRQMFCSQWHSETILEAVACLNRHRYDGEDLPISGNEVDYLKSISRPATDLMQPFMNIVSSALLPNLKSTFRLGLFADELIHPPLCSSVVQIVRPTATLPEVSWSSTRSEDQCSHLPVPNHILQPWPSQGWMRSFELQYPEFLKEQNGLPRSAPFRWNERTELSRILDDVTASVEHMAVEHVDTDTGNDVTNRLIPRGVRMLNGLGLSLDLSNSQLHSRTNEQSERLSPRHCNLLVFLLNRADTPTTTAWFSANWGLFVPRSSTLSEDSVRTAISQLNDILRGHGAVISSGSSGYSIQRRPI